MRKYVTKKLVKRLSETTNNLFKQSVLEGCGLKDATDEQIQDFIFKMRRYSFGYILVSKEDSQDIDAILKQKEDIDVIYLNKMIQLSSDDLQDILFLHKHEKPRRSERTIDMITSELARRSLLNDSSESDTIYHDGDVDVKREDEPIGKKAPNKGSEASKVK